MASLTPSEISSHFESLAPMLRLYLRQWLDESTALDLVQECFIQLIRERKTPEEIRPWMFRVARNKALNWIRSNRRRMERETSAIETDEASERQRWFRSADSEIESREAEQMLRRLSEAERETVVLRIWGDCGFEEIARIQGVSTSQAHRTYHGALEQLRNHLEFESNPILNQQLTQK